MQDINSNISIPFWDWTTDSSITSSLWSQSFLGQFDSDRSLDRRLGVRGQLPSSSNVNSVQSITNWISYTANFEGSIVHNQPHNWVGGRMSESVSPIDPVFYLHHNMIDKLWQDWVEANRIMPSSNIYQKTSMPRYDGTHTFNGQTLPSVNPDDIVDSKSLGVFFAESRLAKLENYTVSNTYNTQENFYYQYTIEAGNNFIIPSGKNAKCESVTEVILKPGFHAKQGSSFVAKIDTDNNTSTRAKGTSVKSIRNQKPFDGIIIFENAYNSESVINEIFVKLYPNPFYENITIEFEKLCTDCKIEIFNLQGTSIFKRESIEGKRLKINLSHIQSGVYLIKINHKNGLGITKKLIKL